MERLLTKLNHNNQDYQTITKDNTYMDWLIEFVKKNNGYADNTSPFVIFETVHEKEQFEKLYGLLAGIYGHYKKTRIKPFVSDDNICYIVNYKGNTYQIGIFGDQSNTIYCSLFNLLNDHISIIADHIVHFDELTNDDPFLNIDNSLEYGISPTINKTLVRRKDK